MGEQNEKSQKEIIEEALRAADAASPDATMRAIESLLPQVERMLGVLHDQTVARTLESLMAAARHAHDIDEGRLREDFLALARKALADRGADGLGSARADDDDGPRAVFDGDKLIAPNGTTWDLGG